MADTKISALTDGATAETTDRIPVSRAGVNRYITPAYLKTLLAGADTWTGDKTLAENVGIVLDAALSADGKYSGIVEAGTAGAALAFGEICYLQTSDSRWELARGNAASTSANKLAICVLAAAADGDPTLMLLFGKVRADSKFPALTVGAPVYISAATAGLITSTAPTGTTDFVVRKIGFGNTADELFFQPSNDYITLA